MFACSESPPQHRRHRMSEMSSFTVKSIESSFSFFKNSFSKFQIQIPQEQAENPAPPYDSNEMRARFERFVAMGGMQASASNFNLSSDESEDSTGSDLEEWIEISKRLNHVSDIEESDDEMNVETDLNESSSSWEPEQKQISSDAGHSSRLPYFRSNVARCGKRTSNFINQSRNGKISISAYFYPFNSSFVVPSRRAFRVRHLLIALPHNSWIDKSLLEET